MTRLFTIRDIVDNCIEKIEVAEGKDKVFIKKNEYTHAYGVASLARLLAMKRGMDPKIAGIMGHLHDIGRILYNMVDSTHGPAGAIEAEKVLKNTGNFNSDEIDIICHAIRSHSDKDSIGEPYDELLKDADIMERFLWNPEYVNENDQKKRIKRICKELGIEKTPAF